MQKRLKKLDDAKARIVGQLVELPCGCVCDRCWRGTTRHCSVAHCKVAAELTPALR